MTTLRTNLKAISESETYMDYPGGRHQFFRDSCEHYGLSEESPQVARAFDFAWDLGHSNGYAEVDNYFGELVIILGTDK